MKQKMRIPRLTGLWVICAGFAILLGCSAQKPPETKVVWQRADGADADRAELKAAADECREATRKSGGAGTGRFSHIEWAANMLDCMKKKGFTRVEETVEPAAAGSEQ